MAQVQSLQQEWKRARTQAIWRGEREKRERERMLSVVDRKALDCKGIHSFGIIDDSGPDSAVIEKQSRCPFFRYTDYLIPIDYCTSILIYIHPMTTISHGKSSLGPSLIVAGGSLSAQDSIPSGLPSARDSLALAINKAQLALRESIIADSKQWKSLYYAPSTTRSVGFPRRLGDLDSEVQTLEKKIMGNMSRLTNQHHYDIQSMRSIAATIPKYSKDVLRQLIENLSQHDDVPTFQEAIEETGKGGAFVELNWVLKEVRRGRELPTDRGTFEGEITEHGQGSVAVVWNGAADSRPDNAPYRLRRISADDVGSERVRYAD